MAGNEKEGEETSSRGADWEVVSLTESAYAAAPGPKGIVLADESKVKEHGGNGPDSARAMFMSGHFVFPPSEHENLPVASDNGEILTEPGLQGVISIKEEAEGPDKVQEENWSIKDLSESDELHGVQFFDKGKKLCVHGMEFEEGKTNLQGLNLVEEEQGMCGGPEFSSFHTETDVSGLIPFDESSDAAELDDPSNQNLGSSAEPIEETKYGGPGFPCEAWWKRRATSLYAHAKEANTFWSICVAAALMGLVILGQQWQQERWQIQRLKWQFSMTDQKFNWLLGPVSRFKDVLVGGQRRAPVIRGETSADR